MILLVLLALSLAACGDAAVSSSLHAAAGRGDVVEVRRLLDAGADADAADEAGETPLSLATAGGHAETVVALLDGGADPETITNEGSATLSSWAIDATGADPRLNDRAEGARAAMLPGRVQPRGIALDPEHRRIYWAEYATDRIRSADLQGGDAATVLADLAGPIGVAVDGARRTLFWTSDASYPRRVARADLDGSRIVTVAQGRSVNRPRAIAVDSGRGEVIWTEAVSGRVIRAGVDGEEIEEIFASGISSVADRPDRRPFRSLGLAVATRTGRLVWTDLASGRIQMADRAAGGESRRVTPRDLATTADGVELPAGIAVDERAGVVYWADVARQAIFRARVDGGGTASVLDREDGLVEPYGLALDPKHGKLYWTDASRDVIARANLDGSLVEERALRAEDPGVFAVPRDAQGCTNVVVDAGRRYLAEAFRSVATCLEKVDALKAVKREASDASNAVSTCVLGLGRWASLVGELRRTFDAACRGAEWRRALAAAANPLAASCDRGTDSTFDAWLGCTVERHRQTAEALVARRHVRAVEWLDEVRPFLAARVGEPSNADAPVALDALDAVVASMRPPAASAIAASVLPASGQTTTYAAATAGASGAPVPVPDDGLVRAGRPAAFRDNRDGTITDLRTGLMWEKKCAGCGGLHDFAVDVRWSGDAQETTVWDWLASMNAEGGTGFAGHADWRIANVKELESIVDYERFNPAVAGAFDGGRCGLGCIDLTDPRCSCTRMSAYWSSTTFPARTSHAIVVAFHLGLIEPRPKSDLAFVRAVRDAPAGH